MKSDLNSLLVCLYLCGRVMFMSNNPIIRAFYSEDTDAVTAIYRHHLLTGTATFEEWPPNTNEMLHRLSGLTKTGFPVLVACTSDYEVTGFAYAGPYKARSAYRFTVEDSIYVGPNHRRKGIGRALLMQLISECRQREYKQILAVIGDSDNQGSIGLHRACGFAHVGTANNLGFKFSRWLDVVFMQLSLEV